MHRRAAYMDDRSGYSHCLDFVCLESWDLAFNVLQN